MGAYVHVIGRNPQTLSLAKQLGASATSTDFEEVDGGFDAVIDCTFDKDVPHKALQVVELGGRVVYIGISGVPSSVDSRDLVLKDVTAVGILSASPGLAGTIDIYGSGKVDPTPIVAATVGLKETSDVLAGKRPANAGVGPKIHINPRKD
jgi:threonine dehydrogenase-like Zn-dependent dehydrogenase